MFASLWFLPFSCAAAFWGGLLSPPGGEPARTCRVATVVGFDVEFKPPRGVSVTPVCEVIPLVQFQRGRP